MRKVQVIVFVGFVVAMIGWVKIHDADTSTRLITPAASASATASAAPGASTATSATPSASSAEDTPDAGAPEAGAGGGGGAGAEMPSLDDAPKAVRFGVILVKYAGAQLAKDDTRSKEEAEKLAKEIAAEAQTDFEAALKKGDRGSTANAGRMFRGLLEADADYALFSLDKGAVSQPVDTPRGFWILKRLE